MNKFFAGIGVAIVSVLGFFLLAFKRKSDEKSTELVKCEAKEVRHEAEAIVKKKTAGELVDDFNRRFPVKGSDDPTRKG